MKRLLSYLFTILLLGDILHAQSIFLPGQGASLNSYTGIGSVSAPPYQLTVKGPYSDPQSLISYDGSNGIYFHAQGNDSHYNWLIGQQRIISGALEFTPSTSPGGNTFSNPALVLRADGFVGIGTNVPNTKLHVYASGGGMEYHPGNDNYFEFIDRYNTEAAVNTSLYTRNGYFAFHTGSYTERLRITNNGNVGIGTQTPSTKLEIVGNSGLTNFTGSDHLGLLIRGSNNAGSDLSGIDFTGYSANYFSYPLARIAVKLTSAGSYMSFGTSNSYVSGITNTAMTIDHGGNVGIGTTSPNTKFHVYASGGGMEYHPGIDNYFEFIDRYDPQASVNTKFYTRNGYFAFYTAGYSERLRITDAGNVGIGTTDPGSYKLNVSGNIRANEIIVNTSGADFVFDPEYNLPDLSEVEKYIEENKHLPDVAPASDMQEDGMSVSEMQTKLLQKVEELTLYIIEQQKEINDLKEKLQQHSDLINEKN